jgi:hypothetical protein
MFLHFLQSSSDFKKNDHEPTRVLVMEQSVTTVIASRPYKTARTVLLQLQPIFAFVLLSTALVTKVASNASDLWTTDLKDVEKPAVAYF